MTEADDKTALRLTAETVRRNAARRTPLAGMILAAWAPRWMTTGGVKTVGGYWPIRYEIDPRPLMRRFIAAGVSVALPVTPRRTASAPLVFRVWRDGDDLRRGGFGVLEPTDDAPVAEPDVMLLPLLAFDRSGGRLGYGAGHYDRTLSALRAIRPVFAVGLGFAAQEAAVPREPHDQPLDAVLTERGYFSIGLPST